MTVCKIRNGKDEACGLSPLTHVWRDPDSDPVDTYICDYHAQCFGGDNCHPLPGFERRTKGSPGWRELGDDDPRPVWQKTTNT
jgi:hypothetical protein